MLRIQSKQSLCVTRKEETYGYNTLPTIVVVVFALAFDFINGFHDTANAIATSVSTRALKPRTAVFMAAIMNFIGALTFTGVAKTISKDIVDPFVLDNGSLVILAALTAAIAWNLITWYYGIPSSSSHAVDRFDCRRSYFCSRIRYFELQLVSENITSASHFSVHRTCGRISS